MPSRDPRRELPHTYLVQDRLNQEEPIRLQIQDQMFTRSMGGVLPEQPDSASFHRILDVGCGPGGWLIEVAQTSESLEMGIGIDASPTIIEAACQSAQTAGVSDRITFQVMDALRMLEFPDHTFDLVNLRFGQSWLRTWDWPKLLQEYQRVTRLGGMIRITESDIYTESTSPALTRLYAIGLSALNQSGHLFGSTNEQVKQELAHLLVQHGLQQVQTQTHMLEYRGETPEGQHFLEDMRSLFRTTLPFLRKWAQIPDDYEEIYQQMLIEMQHPDFMARVRLHTIWGIN